MHALRDGRGGALQEVYGVQFLAGTDIHNSQYYFLILLLHASQTIGVCQQGF